MPRTKRTPQAAADSHPDAIFQRLRRARGPDQRALLREQLIMAHMKLVRFLAQKFANRGEPLDDLVQVGTIGLINAIDRFDTDRGIRFATYATPTILGEIKRYFRDRGWAIKVPRKLQEINLKATRAADALVQRLDRAPTVAEIAAQIGETEEETLEAMELGQHYELASLNGEVGSAEDESPSVLGDYVGQRDSETEDFGMRVRLEEAIPKLPERERSVIQLRFYAGMSQTDVAKKMGISQMHVSRLQHKAIQRLKQLVREVAE